MSQPLRIPVELASVAEVAAARVPDDWPALPMGTAGDPRPPSLRLRVARVHDADTFFGSLDLMPRHPLFSAIGVRVFGVDCPELDSANPDHASIARQGRQWLYQVLPADAVVALVNARADKYFRILAHVDIPGLGDLADALVKRGFARPYFGRGPKPW